MPSKARKLFKNKLLPDVAKLVDVHGELNPPGRGRRRLGHITRSGVIMLCAGWELYIETVCVEAIDFLCRGPDHPGFLPDRPKGIISRCAKGNKHEFGVLELCHHGWKKVYRDGALKDCENLNTPKFGQVSKLLHDWLGVEQRALAGAWRHSKETLNDIVSLRGEIAHRGADARYVKRDELKELSDLINDFSIDTDNFLSDYLKDISVNSRRPWNKIPVHH